MILLFGRVVDPIIASLSLHLIDLEAPFAIVDPGREGLLDLEWKTQNGVLSGTVQIGERVVAAQDIQSMFIREIGWSSEQATLPASNYSRARAESLWAMTDAFHGLVMNRRLAVCTNASKPYQLELIHRHGFHVPQTLVTTDANAALSFWEEQRHDVIYKSLSSERSIVKPLQHSDLGRLEVIRHCPVQLQQRVDGVDIRVHVVGERVFATEIRSTVPDYRYAERDGADRQMRPIELPLEIAAQCRSLTRALGLVLSGVDLRRTSEGSYYCFEVNPSPAYLWFEDITGQRIGAAVASLLARGEVQERHQHEEGGSHHGRAHSCLASTVH
ncbi:MAG: hypothetical protein U0172_05220 [Nitrospiraceae bacterium]